MKIGGKHVSPVELRVALAVQSFLAEFPGQWLSEYVLFPDRVDWSARKNKLSCFCRLRLMRLRNRGVLTQFGIDSAPLQGCFQFRYSPLIQRKVKLSVLDRLLGEQR